MRATGRMHAVCALAAAVAASSATTADALFGLPTTPAVGQPTACSALDQQELNTAFLIQCPKECTNSPLERELWGIDSCRESEEFGNQAEYGEKCQTKGECARWIAGLGESQRNCLATYHGQGLDAPVFSFQLDLIAATCGGTELTRSTNCTAAHASKWSEIHSACQSDCAYYTEAAPQLGLQECGSGDLVNKYGDACKQSTACTEYLNSLTEHDKYCHPFSEHTRKWIDNRIEMVMKHCYVGPMPPPPPPPPSRCASKWLNLLNDKCKPECDYGETAWNFECHDNQHPDAEKISWGGRCSEPGCKRMLNNIEEDWYSDADCILFFEEVGMTRREIEKDVEAMLWSSCFGLSPFIKFVITVAIVLFCLCFCCCCVVCAKHPKCPLFKILFARKMKAMIAAGKWPPPQAAPVENKV